MKKMIVKNGLLAGTIAFSLALASPIVATAANARAAEAQTRLTDAQLRVCQRHEVVITNIMARISQRGQKQLDLFTTIAERTEAFYVNKGKTLSNYDALVADVNAKKVDAQTAVDATKTVGAEFKCDGTDPKGVATAFKEDLKNQIDALKAYKTAVKNLIVGVKSVQGSTASTENSSAGGNQ